MPVKKGGEMNLSLLKVLHIQSYNNQGNEQNPMTCARHVYIFTESTEYDIKGLQTYVEAHSKKCEWLTGIEAYGFLLRWAVGAESHKLKSNDHFVLGDIRDAWKYHTATNKAIDTTLIKLIQILLEDARHIRHAIQGAKVTDNAFKELLIRMCQNCLDSRKSNETPAYEALLQSHQDYLEVAQKEFFRKKVTGLSKSMKALNLKSEIESVLPTHLKDNTPQISMFRANLLYALQRNQLIHRNQPQAQEPSTENAPIKQAMNM